MLKFMRVMMVTAVAQIAGVAVAQTPPPVPIIEIVIHSSSFRDVFTAPGLGCTGRGTGFVSITIKDKNSDFELSGTNVKVKKKTKLRFKVLCQDLAVNPFFPVGIAFKQVEPKLPINPDPNKPEAHLIEALGLDNFDPAEIKQKDHQLNVECNYKTMGKEYDFYLFVQDGRTGEIGIIDPKIIHESIVLE